MDRLLEWKVTLESGHSIIYFPWEFPQHAILCGSSPRPVLHPSTRLGHLDLCDDVLVVTVMGAVGWLRCYWHSGSQRAQMSLQRTGSPAR